MTEFPEEQTCCGQPFFNTEARAMARRWLQTFGRSLHQVLAEARLTVTLGVHGPQHLHVSVT